jgi:hypothetical protein
MLFTIRDPKKNSEKEAATCRQMSPFLGMKRKTKGIGRFQDEQRALTMVYWQLKELKWHGITMKTAVKAVLALQE